MSGGFSRFRALIRGLPHQRTSTMPTAESEYKAAHKRVVEAKGPASHKPCQFCGTFAAEWSYTHQDPAEIYRDGYLWSESTAYYMPLCKRDHRAYDRAFRQHGKPVLDAVADALMEAGQQRYDEEHRRAVKAMTLDWWRVRETGLGYLSPEESAAIADAHR